MSRTLRADTARERDYAALLTTYKAYINDSAVGDVNVQYLAQEIKEGPQGERHQNAREKASTLEQLLCGELAGIDVMRDDEWVPLLRKVR